MNAHVTIDIPTLDDEWEAVGDPTEAALQAFAWKADMSKPALMSSQYQLVEEYAFDSSLKRMSVICTEAVQDGGVVHHVFVKGSIESLLTICSQRIQEDGSCVDIEVEFKA